MMTRRTHPLVWMLLGAVLGGVGVYRFSSPPSYADFRIHPRDLRFGGGGAHSSMSPSMPPPPPLPAASLGHDTHNAADDRAHEHEHDNAGDDAHQQPLFAFHHEHGL